MHIYRIIALSVLACIPINLHADATADLFAAIEAQNSEKVAQALKAGADTESKRACDGMNAKTFAAQQVQRICHTPMPLIGSFISSLGLVVASTMNNGKYTIMGIAAVLAGLGLSIYKENDTPEQQNTLQKITARYELDNIISYMGTATLLASAWMSKKYIVSGIGTIGLASWYYQGSKIRTACQIYLMVDPEHELIPEIA